ncbi:Elongation factor 1-alpha [Capsicum chinense]|nr:Elongation factor 1-alpha [Capsicum chinense]
MHHKALQEAPPGDNAGFNVDNVVVKDLKCDWKQICPCSRLPHLPPIAVKFAEILTKIDRWSGKEHEEEVKFLKNGDAGMVKMIPAKPMVVGTFSKYPPLGRFAVRDMHQTAAVGIIRTLTRRIQPVPRSPRLFTRSAEAVCFD